MVFKRFLPVIFISSLLISCFSSTDKQPRSSARVDAPKDGVTLEADYDPRLDNLVPGYKIITVALTNNSFEVIKLNPLKDRWEIIDAAGRPRKAINSIRVHNPRIFSSLPSQMQTLVDYPVGVNIGYSETIDLFFPQSTDLRNFRTISFYVAEWDKKIDAMANLDSPTAVPVNPPTTAKPVKSGKGK